MKILSLILSLIAMPLMGGQFPALFWQPSPDTNIVGYNVYVGGGNPTNDGTFLYKVPLNSHTFSYKFTNLIAGMKYFVSVKSLNSSSNESVALETNFYTASNPNMTVTKVNSNSVISFLATAGYKYTLEVDNPTNDPVTFVAAPTVNGPYSFSLPYNPSNTFGLTYSYNLPVSKLYNTVNTLMLVDPSKTYLSFYTYDIKGFTLKFCNDLGGNKWSVLISNTNLTPNTWWNFTDNNTYLECFYKIQ